MFSSSWRRFVNPLVPASRRASPRPRGPRLYCEELEPRLQPSAFSFSTGLPDGKVATVSEPANVHNGQVEYESADDFVLNTETRIQHASFTGLLTGGATPKDVSNVVVEIYRVFPNDSDVGRTSGPPTFSTPKVPTRVNSPADVALDSRDSASGELHFHTHILSNSFTAQSSVSSADKIGVHSGGNGPATGEEVQLDVTLSLPFDLPAGHYFFVPQVGLSDSAPAGADFLWLSAPKPIQPPGTPFTPDLQSWMRDDPPLAPDWLRIGTDIIGGTTFNASFSLFGNTVRPAITSLSQTSVPEGSPDLALTVNGRNFTSQSTVLLNGVQPLATTFVNAGRLQVIVPASFLAEEGHFRLSVLDAENGLSNSTTFRVTESIPVLSASATQGQVFQQITVSGQVSDTAIEDHRVKVRWGDGQVDVLDLGISSGGPFSISHTFAQPGHTRHDAIVVTALDDAGAASAPQTFDVIV
jgi:hypothetical protein